MFFQMPPKPSFRNMFKQDLYNRLIRMSNNNTGQQLRQVLMQECVMYSCDMCLEFQRKSEGLLTIDYLEHIVTETVEAIRLVLPQSLSFRDNQIAIEKVKSLMQQPGNLFQAKVDKYYNRC